MTAFTKLPVSVVKNLCNEFIKEAKIDKKEQQEIISRDIDILVNDFMAKKWFAPKSREIALAKLLKTHEYRQILTQFDIHNMVLDNRLEKVDKLLRMCYCHNNFGETSDRYIYLDDEIWSFWCNN